MGLDMYLSAKRYVSRHFEGDKQLYEQLNNLDIPGRPGEIREVVSQAAYWRKANAIHKWFVENVQEGEDDCRTYYVSREQLQELLDKVNQVLADRSQARKLLPTESGFFFGSTDYDEWYWMQLEATRDQLTKALEADDNWSFEYQSSW